MLAFDLSVLDSCKSPTHQRVASPDVQLILDMRRFSTHIAVKSYRGDTLKHSGLGNFAGSIRQLLAERLTPSCSCSATGKVMTSASTGGAKPSKR